MPKSMLKSRLVSQKFDDLGALLGEFEDTVQECEWVYTKIGENVDELDLSSGDVPDWFVNVYRIFHEVEMADSHVSECCILLRDMLQKSQKTVERQEDEYQKR